MNNNISSWISAARPKTLPVSLSPVLIGGAFALKDAHFVWLPFVVCIVFAFLLQIISNLANDYYDFKNNIDVAERTGPQRMVASGIISPERMKSAVFILLVIALLCGCILIFYGGWNLIFLGVIIALAALSYSGGPYPLSHHGLGDIAVCVFFGIVPVCFTYYVQALTITLPVLIAGISIGLVADNVLIVNNYRDYYTDKKANKRTTVVMFGRKFAAFCYLMNAILGITGIFFSVHSMTVFAYLLLCLWTIMHVGLFFNLIHCKSGDNFNKLLGKTAINVFIFALFYSFVLLF